MEHYKPCRVCGEHIEELGAIFHPQCFTKLNMPTRNIRVRTCIRCETEFSYHAVRGADRIYCTKECKSAAERDRRIEILNSFPVCDEKDCDLKVKSRNSKWCEKHYVRRRRVGIKQGLIKVSTEPHPCIICRKSISGSTARCCSAPCYRAWKRGKPVERFCPVCDASLGLHAVKSRIYCGPTCTGRAGAIRNYGMTVEEFRNLQREQKNACAICGRDDRPLMVDHCHSTLYVRGLLCQDCNFGIGFLRDSPERLESAIRYLSTRKVT